MKNYERGSAGLVVLLIVSVAGLLASNTIDKESLKNGKVKLDKAVIENRQPVDYSKMND